MKVSFVAIFCLFGIGLFSQGTIRGKIFDETNGEPILFGNVFLDGTTYGTTTDEEGLYTITNLPKGTYTLVATYIGYDSTSTIVTVGENQTVTKNLFMKAGGIQLGDVTVSAERQRAENEVAIGAIAVTTEQIKSLPSTGGEPDLAQYLPALPGIIFSGDQGGQLYIRGGSPVQNKILLDGMPIYQPFHSIGFFSVFETEVIRTVDVYTAAFNAEYGGRINAVVDIKTREGDKKRHGGLVSLSPFQAKVLAEGPLKPLDEKGASISYLLTAKQSLIDETSKTLYEYASEGEDGLPFFFRDIYGKVSLLSGNGSKLNAFGFGFTDEVVFSNIADLSWQNFGGGLDFTLLPSGSSMVIDGLIAFNQYDLELIEDDGQPRSSGINGFNVALNFTNYGTDSELKFGIELEGLDTEFDFVNFLGTPINQDQNTLEFSAFGKYERKFNKLIIEPSLRVQYYTALGEFSLEPRFGIKYNALKGLRFKAGGGLYSQNLISTTSDLDVVNLFQGFLTGPDRPLRSPDGSGNLDTRLQKSRHLVAGVEIDLSRAISINIEPYYKEFTHLIELNRNKESGSESNFQAEEGEALGVDFSIKYDKGPFYLWGTYSLSEVNRFDGEQDYPPVYDRRHNVNLLGSYAFGQDESWELGVRWNMGSGFPFTQTQGFYGLYDFTESGNIDYETENPDLGILLDDDLNRGRLPYYHRLDASIKKMIQFSEHNKLTITASVTNAYNRENIFFFDRVELDRVDQLPILPSLGATWEF